MRLGERVTARSPQPDVDQVWSWLRGVPDPEIPVISVVDLGIVRGVEWQDDTLVVTVTPTYSGCPATEVIARDIEEALKAHNVARFRLATRLAPAWSTDWISEGGRQRLKGYGIAPPEEGAHEVRVDVASLFRKAVTVDCPRCGSGKTQRVSEFGSTPCKAHYKCRDCLEPFDYFKRL